MPPPTRQGVIQACSDVPAVFGTVDDDVWDLKAAHSRKKDQPVVCIAKKCAYVTHGAYWCSLKPNLRLEFGGNWTQNWTKSSAELV